MPACLGAKAMPIPGSSDSAAYGRSRSLMPHVASGNQSPSLGGLAKARCDLPELQQPRDASTSTCAVSLDGSHCLVIDSGSHGRTLPSVTRASLSSLPPKRQRLTRRGPEHVDVRASHGRPHVVCDPHAHAREVDGGAGGRHPEPDDRCRPTLVTDPFVCRTPAVRSRCPFESGGRRHTRHRIVP
jgi:hypothetical protein